ncbi:hypothetical protein FMK52_26250 [Klebsiella pneumoniae]|nr:hypothetical protein HMPREF9538_04062 [Klebsiella sp. MS 92-3]EIW8575078.1 hypothetical protein [Klebsiella pneumoniae]ESB02616.1 hypothetical protein HMPREF1619_01181 [Klebsiella pneumoniae 909957]RTY17620.1 hypothetical protein EKS87_00345 [Klebsiella pneumoniae subsp. pneumoniae]TYC78423.1 hypothetical protein E4M18_020880 [Klebsiella sp. Z2]BAH61217.1 hypothetical protein KP1_0323 [Klebsiella pneumoniae subsp. pneumoniae NTUH-K2044]HBZ0069802.1 hypothetical protein [Klebsiella pneumoni
MMKRHFCFINLCELYHTWRFIHQSKNELLLRLITMNFVWILVSNPGKHIFIHCLMIIILRVLLPVLVYYTEKPSQMRVYS